jgi:SAM-dependent methyltransferase
VVVDVGGGTGLLASRLRSDGHRVVCVDRSLHMLRRAAHRQAVPECVQGRAEAMPLASRCADVVVAANVLHLHPNPGDVIAECLRVLRPGGRLICLWPRGHAGVTQIARAERHLGLRSMDVLGRAAIRIAAHAGAVMSRGVRRTSEADIVAALRVASSDIDWIDLPTCVQTLAVLDIPKEPPCPTRQPGRTSPCRIASQSPFRWRS